MIIPKALNNAYSEFMKAGATKNYVHELHLFVQSVLETAFKPDDYKYNALDGSPDLIVIGEIFGNGESICLSKSKTLSLFLTMVI